MLQKRWFSYFDMVYIAWPNNILIQESKSKEYNALHVFIFFHFIIFVQQIREFTSSGHAIPRSATLQTTSIHSTDVFHDAPLPFPPSWSRGTPETVSRSPFSLPSDIPGKRIPTEPSGAGGGTTKFEHRSVKTSRERTWNPVGNVETTAPYGPD